MPFYSLFLLTAVVTALFLSCSHIEGLADTQEEINEGKQGTNLEAGVRNQTGRRYILG